MRARVGTSGFSFAEWKGHFYPADLPSSRMLAHYAGRLPAVELNNTFYRLPEPQAFESWHGQVPAHFRFAIKAPRRITHMWRLRNCDAAVAELLGACAGLKKKLGVVLYQLPPNFKKDVERLSSFLSAMQGHRCAFEFRHPSWFDDEVYAALRAGRAALVAGDTESDDLSLPLVPTTDFGYLRLRAPSYTTRQLSAWAKKIQAQGWRDVFVFFKHEVQGPAYAETLLAKLG